MPAEAGTTCALCKRDKLIEVVYGVSNRGRRLASKTLAVCPRCDLADMFPRRRYWRKKA